MSQIQYFTPASGPGSGTVTSISAGEGITLTPNPITTTGTVALTVPVVIADGGTNATSFTNTDGVVYFDGTRLVDTAVGTSGQVLTSNGVGMAPTFQNAGASSISITGDAGGAQTGNAFDFTGGATGLVFDGAADTFTLAGTLIVAHGGTDSVSFNTNGVVISGVSSTAALTALSLTDGQVVIGSSAGAPTAATLTAGTGISITNGHNSITIAANGSAVVETITGDSGGPESPSAGNFTFTGGSTGLTFAGTAATETLTGTLIVANGGTGRATLTNHGLLVGAGTAAITQLGDATNGQLPIGSTGADPVLATITAGTNITVTNGAGTITIAANATSAVFNYVSVNHAASPYTALSTDYYISADVTAGVITILLPNAPVTGRVFVVKDKVGLSSTSNITVTTVGGAVTIDGSTTFVMNTNYESAEFIFNGTSYEVF